MIPCLVCLILCLSGVAFCLFTLLSIPPLQVHQHQQLAETNCLVLFVLFVCEGCIFSCYPPLQVHQLASTSCQKASLSVDRTPDNALESHTTIDTIPPNIMFLYLFVFCLFIMHSSPTPPLIPPNIMFLYLFVFGLFEISLTHFTFLFV